MQDLKAYFRNNNILVKLILINVAVWMTIMILDVMFDLFKVPYIDNIIEWLAVPASVGKLITRPWTVFTYMFLHYDLWHILFNMLWLYWFGRIFLQYLSDKQLLWTYILGGLAGALVYILSFNIFPKFQDVFGHTIVELAEKNDKIIGITPAISIIEHIVINKLDTNVILLYSNRSIEDIAFKPELDRWNELPNINVFYRVNEEQAGENVSVGKIDDEYVKSMVADLQSTTFYSFGPPRMVDAMIELCNRIGCKKIITETFLGY